MNIHLPMFTRGTRFWHTAIFIRFHKELKLADSPIHQFTDFGVAMRKTFGSQMWLWGNALNVLDAALDMFGRGSSLVSWETQQESLKIGI